MTRLYVLMLFVVVKVHSSSVQFSHMKPVRPPVWGAIGANGWPGSVGHGVGGVSGGNNAIASPNVRGKRFFCRFFTKRHFQRSYAGVLLPRALRWTVHRLCGRQPV